MQIGRLIAILTIFLLVGCGKEEPQTEGSLYAGVSNIKLDTSEITISNDIGKQPVKESVQAKWTSVGTFKLTGYCSCYKCCGKWAECRPNGIVYGASGMELAPTHSVAVDTSVIPYGTVLLINGTEYVAQDCGGGIKGNHIDIYFATHEEAVRFGVQYAEVFIEVNEDE